MADSKYDRMNPREIPIWTAKADSKNTLTMEQSARWFLGQTMVARENNFLMREWHCQNAATACAAHAEREALLTECRVMLALFERMAQFDTPACISFAERDAARALFYRISKEQA